MKLLREEDRIIYDELHNDLIDSDPFVEVRDGVFVGQIIISDEFSVGSDCPVYEFEVSGLVDMFIHEYQCGDMNGFDAEGLNKAKILVKELKTMIKKLEDRIDLSKN